MKKKQWEPELYIAVAEYLDEHADSWFTSRGTVAVAIGKEISRIANQMLALGYVPPKRTP